MTPAGSVPSHMPGHIHKTFNRSGTTDAFPAVTTSAEAETSVMVEAPVEATTVVVERSTCSTPETLTSTGIVVISTPASTSIVVETPAPSISRPEVSFKNSSISFPGISFSGPVLTASISRETPITASLSIPTIPNVHESSPVLASASAAGGSPIVASVNSPAPVSHGVFVKSKGVTTTFAAPVPIPGVSTAAGSEVIQNTKVVNSGISGVPFNTAPLVTAEIPSNAVETTKAPAADQAASSPAGQAPKPNAQAPASPIDHAAITGEAPASTDSGTTGAAGNLASPAPASQAASTSSSLTNQAVKSTLPIFFESGATKRFENAGVAAALGAIVVTIFFL